MQGGFLSAFFQLLTLGVIFICVLALTYWVTKKIAHVKQGGQKTKNLQIMEVLQIGGGQYLSIVRIGTTYHLIGSTKDHINYCKELDAASLQFEPVETPSFNEYLARFKHHNGENQHED